MPVERPITVYLENGGSNDAKGNYAAAATTFSAGPSAPDRWVITRMIVTIQDGGVLDAGAYGNNIVLSNGIKVNAVYADETIDMLGGDPVLTNAGWGKICHDVKEVDFGAGDNYISVRWTFAKHGRPITLQPGETIEVVLEDNFTGLTGHFFCLEGYRIDG